MSEISLDKESQSCISYNVLVNDTTSEFDSSSDVSLFARSSTSIVSESSAADDLEVTITETITRSSSSIMSILSATTDDLENTVIEADTGVEPDYKTQCEEYKRLLKDKIALEKYEEYKRLLNDKTALEKEHQHLRESFKKLEALKEVAENKLKENELKAQNNNIVNIKKICTRRTKEMIKAKSKRKTGSTKNVELSTCEFPSCNTEDADLVLCSSCGRYVCEACNGIPVNKLKQLIKVCGTIHYLCKTCSEVVTDDCEKETDDSKHLKILREEIKDKVKIIARAEANQEKLNDLVKDKDEIIDSQRKIIENTGLELKETREALLDSRVVLEAKENDLSKYRMELQLSMERNPSDTGLKDANNTLIQKLEDQNTLIKKTELAYETQEKLLSTKCEIIESLKRQISEGTPFCGNIDNRDVTTDLTSQNGETSSKNGETSQNGDSGNGTIETLKSFLSEQVTKIENNLKGMIETKLSENKKEIAVLNKNLCKVNASSDTETSTETNKTVTWSDIVSQQEPNITTMMRDARNDEKIEESEKERRSKNIIIHGAEEVGENPENIKSEDNQYVSEIFKKLGVTSKPSLITRLGQPNDSKSRPIKIVMNTKADKEKVMKSLGRLKGTERYFGKISVKDDYTTQERECIRLLTERAKKQTNENPERIFKVRGDSKNGWRVVSFPKGN